MLFILGMHSLRSGALYDCPRSILFKLVQTGSVSYYYVEFTSLANGVYSLSQDTLLDCFLSGLQTNIKKGVAQGPISLTKAVALSNFSALLAYDIYLYLISFMNLDLWDIINKMSYTSSFPIQVKKKNKIKACHVFQNVT